MTDWIAHTVDILTEELVKIEATATKLRHALAALGSEPKPVMGKKRKVSVRRGTIKEVALATVCGRLGPTHITEILSLMRVQYPTLTRGSIAVTLDLATRSTTPQIWKPKPGYYQGVAPTMEPTGTPQPTIFQDTMGKNPYIMTGKMFDQAPVSA